MALEETGDGQSEVTSQELSLMGEEAPRWGEATGWKENEGVGVTGGGLK